MNEQDVQDDPPAFHEKSPWRNDWQFWLHCLDLRLLDQMEQCFSDDCEGEDLALILSVEELQELAHLALDALTSVRLLRTSFCKPLATARFCVLFLLL
ncbi:hypothetical protein RvY_12381 [Ramazzottius varieornatus]|uniref:Uncharacterized protein n=1 Tax=Ramazzottius varieornatus TaxID=947166 RepID=A0A1D1VJD5_RAMVA|nr:hypothetical protein RvY_12381 [Ramazzottius varieornatus]